LVFVFPNVDWSFGEKNVFDNSFERKQVLAHMAK